MYPEVAQRGKIEMVCLLSAGILFRVSAVKAAFLTNQ